MMEEETCFLSSGGGEDNKMKLKKLFERVMKDLNEHKISTIVGKWDKLVNFQRNIKVSCVLAEGDTTIYLKIVTHKPDPPPVKEHMVPLLLQEFKDTPIDNWDLTTQQVN